MARDGESAQDVSTEPARIPHRPRRRGYGGEIAKEQTRSRHPSDLGRTSLPGTHGRQQAGSCG